MRKEPLRFKKRSFTLLLTASVIGLLVVLISGIDARAQTTYYVRAGATGANNGSDWTNAYASMPSSMKRGAVYYIASGSYGSYNFAAPASGTSLITVRKATAADHGTDAGWNSGYGDGQATFASWTISTGYWWIDGQTGGGPGSWETGFGFKIKDLSSSMSNTGVTNVTIRHVDINAGDTGNTNHTGVDIRYVTNFNMSHCYIHDVGCDIFKINQLSSLVVEYSKMARNYQEASGCHGDVFEHVFGNSQNIVVRHNLFEDVVGSYAFGSHETGTITGYEIYGNIMYWTKIIPFFGNGIVGCLSAGGTVNGLKFHNNTISGPFSGQFGFYLLRGSNNVAYNNIWHKASGTSYGLGFDNASHSNNTFYNASVAGETQYSGNPFINSAAGDFRLKSPSDPGRSLSSPYNLDLYGRTRGMDGNWDRGALEYAIVPSTPMNFHITQ